MRLTERPPKVQSALLEAIEERKVTIGKTTFKLPAAVSGDRHAKPGRAIGHLRAAGAQLDRFMLCHRLNYPSTEEEREVYDRT